MTCPRCIGGFMITNHGNTYCVNCGHYLAKPIREERIYILTPWKALSPEERTAQRSARMKKVWDEKKAGLR